MITSRKPNLAKLNKIRVIARKIKNEGFQREYRALINPILDLYKRRIMSDDEMLYRVKEAIIKIERIAVNYQYIPNHASTKRKSEPNFNDHEHLYHLEKTCKALLY